MTSPSSFHHQPKGNKMTKAKSTAIKPVLVTTEFRGVFFGYLKSQDGQNELTLTGARNCISWSASVGGVFGLASNGPNNQCKIGARVPQITLYKITSVLPCEDAAVQAWEKA